MSFRLPPSTFAPFSRVYWLRSSVILLVEMSILWIDRLLRRTSKYRLSIWCITSSWLFHVIMDWHRANKLLQMTFSKWWTSRTLGHWFEHSNLLLLSRHCRAISRFTIFTVINSLAHLNILSLVKNWLLLYT